MKDTYENSQFVVENLEDASRSLAFFPQISREVSRHLSNFVDRYKKLGAIYSLYVRGHLKEAKKQGTAHDKTPDVQKRREFAEEKLLQLFKSSIELYLDAKQVMPKLAGNVRKKLSRYEKYLQGRFIKTDDEETFNIIFDLF